MQKRKIKFNGIDVLIVLVIISCVVGILLRNYDINKLRRSAETDKVQISFVISGISDSSKSVFSEGDVYYIADTERKFGELSSFTVNQSVSLIQKTDGTAVEAKVPGKLDVEGTFMCMGEMTDKGFLLGGTEYIYVNQELSVQSKMYRAQIRITDITMAEQSSDIVQ